LSERYYSDISELVECYDTASANGYLKAGYELLKIGEKTLNRPDGTQETIIVYVLGKRRIEVKGDYASVIEGIPFKPYRPGEEAGWVFNDPERFSGEQREAIKWLAEKIEREGKVTVGRFTYTFSGPNENPKRFISRKPAEVR